MSDTIIQHILITLAMRSAIKLLDINKLQCWQPIVLILNINGNCFNFFLFFSLIETHNSP